MAVTNVGQKLTCDGCGKEIDSNSRQTKKLDANTNNVVFGHWCEACLAKPFPKPGTPGVVNVASDAKSYTVGGPKVPQKQI